MIALRVNSILNSITRTKDKEKISRPEKRKAENQVERLQRTKNIRNRSAETVNSD